MVNNSLLMAYDKQEKFMERLREKDYLAILQTRLDFYKMEGHPKKAKEVEGLMWEFRYIFANVKKVFSNKEIFLERYINNADELLYPDCYKTDFIDCHNQILMLKVVEALNEKFPDEQWEFGELPLFQSQMLSWPGRDYNEEDEKAWAADGAKKDRWGDWWTSFAGDEYCIYQKQIKEKMLAEIDNLENLALICDEALKNEQFFLVPTSDYRDTECASIVGQEFPLNFKEGADREYRHSEKLFTPHERVINDAIVQEVDERCASRVEVQSAISYLDKLQTRFEKFLKEGKFTKKKVKASEEES